MYDNSTCAVHFSDEIIQICCADYEEIDDICVGEYHMCVGEYKHALVSMTCVGEYDMCVGEYSMCVAEYDMCW